MPREAGRSPWSAMQQESVEEHHPSRTTRRGAGARRPVPRIGVKKIASGGLFSESLASQERQHGQGKRHDLQQFSLQLDQSKRLVENVADAQTQRTGLEHML